MSPSSSDSGFVPPLLLLTVVTGLVDATSYLKLGHVFVANMTGNVVFLGFALAGAKGLSVATSLAALAFFLAGEVAGGRISARGVSAFGRKGLLFTAIAFESVRVGAAAIMAAAGGAAGAWRYGLVGLLASSLGVQNATVRRLAVAELTTTVLTMTLTGIAADSRLAAGPGSRFGRRGSAIAAMFAGALAGAWLVLNVDVVAPLVVLAVLASAAVLTLSLSRGQGTATA